GELLAEAREHHAQAAQHLAEQTENAAKIRSDALAESERTRLRQAKETEDMVAAVQAELARRRDAMQREYTARKEQLRRETELLADRKRAVLAQLASLSALAQQSAESFPDADPFA